jgi:hypothetical protein
MLNHYFYLNFFRNSCQKIDNTKEKRDTKKGYQKRRTNDFQRKRRKFENVGERRCRILVTRHSGRQKSGHSCKARPSSQSD